MRRGLPRELTEEVKISLRPIFLKYLSMGKPHMRRYRIIGIMHDAFLEIIRESVRAEDVPKPTQGACK
jgi:hypothetical protein